jgi:hypothetical protein
MTPLFRRSTISVLGFALVAAALQSSPSANHSGNGYHWARNQNPLQLHLGNNVSSPWSAYLFAASADWNQSSVLVTDVVAGKAKGRTCRPPSGRVEVCNAAYGFNGWLGVAQIWVSDGEHITQGAVKLNDSYFNTAGYNTPDWRQMVTCQEIGHTFGLGHQDENFNNTPLFSCMDYQDPPYPSPNAHDFEQLEIIYSHLDSPASATSSQGASGVDLDAPSQWGQLMKSSRGGRQQVFERDFGNGQRVVTFVFWA